jgi:hypothetical protein
MQVDRRAFPRHSLQFPIEVKLNSWDRGISVSRTLSGRHSPQTLLAPVLFGSDC